MATSPTQPAYVEAGTTDQRDWVPIVFLFVTPALAIAGVAASVATHGWSWLDLIPFGLMYWVNGLAITAGYHRYYTHRSFEASHGVQLAMLLAGASCVQNSVLSWASNHRYHHQHVDTEGDPYNIHRGFWFAHWGWIFWKNPPNRPFRNVADLKRDPLVLWQHRWYPLLAIGVGFVLPALLGALWGRPLEGALWGGLVRLVVVHHITFMINSAAHTFGHENFAGGGTARDSTWLACIGFGEGYHSFHHAFPADYRIGIAWHAFDPGKWLINALAALGLATRLKRGPEEKIEAARLRHNDRVAILVDADSPIA